MAKPVTALSDVEFVAFDLETTGLFPISCRIVEFGAVRFTLPVGELETFEQIVDPQCPIPPDATNVHGITDAMAHGMPTVAEVLPRFLEFLGGSEAILLAHNASFDIGFLGLAMAKLRIPFPANPVIDTLDLSRKYVRGLRSHRLEEVARHFGVAENEDHRGLSDARLALADYRTLADADPSMIRQRADIVDASTDILEDMLTEVVAVEPNDEKGQEIVPLWADDYRTYLQDRRNFADRLRETGENLSFYETEVGIPISERIETFAGDNEMPACAPPRDLSN